MPKINSIYLLWSIREIPSNELNLPDKGILTMILAATGINGKCIYSLGALSKVCGLSIRRIQPRLKNIAEKGFILIKKPSHTTHGSYYKYDLNIDKIMNYCPVKSPDEMSGDNEKDTESHRTKRPRSPDETSEVTGRSVRRIIDSVSERKKEGAARRHAVAGGAAPGYKKNNGEARCTVQEFKPEQKKPRTEEERQKDEDARRECMEKSFKAMGRTRKAVNDKTS